MAAEEKGKEKKKKRKREGEGEKLERKEEMLMREAGRKEGVLREVSCLGRT